jgi:hypothetical protein
MRQEQVEVPAGIKGDGELERYRRPYRFDPSMGETVAARSMTAVGSRLSDW